MPLPPVKVISGSGVFLQTVVVPAMVAVGNGFTVTVALPEAKPHAEAAASCTPVNEYINVPDAAVGAVTVTVLLPPVVLTVWLAPPLML